MGEIELERFVKEGLIAQNEGEITVALDTSLKDELILERLGERVCQ